MFKKLRTSSGAILFVGILATSTLVPIALATPATANITDGEHNNDNTATTPDGTPGGTEKCKDDQALYSGDRRLYEGAYHNCVKDNKPPFTSSRTLKKCTVGLMVFNMWGTGVKPAAGGAVTRVNNPNTCITGFKYRLWTENPTNTGDATKNPWGNPTATEQPMYRNSRQYKINEKAITVSSVLTLKDANNRVTNGTVIQDGLFGDRCETVATPNMFSTTYDKLLKIRYANMDEREKTLAKFRYNLNKSIKEKESLNLPSNRASILADIAGVNPGYTYNYLPAGGLYPPGAPKPAGTTASYDDGWATDTNNMAVTDTAFDTVFIKYNCASNLNYVSEISATQPKGSNPAAIKFRGVCWIPIERVGRKWAPYQDATTLDIATQSGDWQFGERFSEAWATDGQAEVKKRGKIIIPAKPSTAQASWQRANLLETNLRNGELPGFTGQALVNTWRTRIAQWYEDAAANNRKTQDDKNPFWKGNRQLLPAAAYKKTGGKNGTWRASQNNKVATAKTMLKNGVQCEPAAGSIASFTYNDPVEPAELSLHLELKTPPTLYAGGATHSAVFKIEPDETYKEGIECVIKNTTTPCDPQDYTFKSAVGDFWHAPLDVKATSFTEPFASLPDLAYKSSSDENDLTASYVQKSLTSTWFNNNNPQELKFYRATPKNGAIRTTVPSVTGKASVLVKQQSTPGLVIRDPDTGTDFLKMDPVLVDVWKTQPFVSAHIKIGQASYNTKNVPATAWPTQPVTAATLRP